jgi:hypothetical protein
MDLNLSEEFFQPDMYKFRHDGGDCDLSVNTASERFPAFLPTFAAAPPHTVLEYEGFNYYIFSAEDLVTHIKYNKDLTSFTINLKQNLTREEADGFILTNCVNSALRRIFITAVADRGGVCLHSSTIKFGGQAVCFSAPSGTGKTTHTNLWRGVYPDVEVLNGDMCYLFVEDGAVWFYGAPWCGTSGECMNERVSVRSVVFLEQAKENIIRELEPHETFMRLSARCFMPAWDERLFLKALDTVEAVTGMLTCRHFLCLPNEDAVKVCHKGVFV